MGTKLLKTIKPLLIFMLLVNLSACSSINSTVGGFFNMDTDLELKFKVAADINPDDDNKPSPLFLRMYELKSPRMFKKANFIDLYEKDKDVLGADMISKQRLKRIKPGESRKESFVLDKGTRYVGLYAEFLQYKKSGFKLLIPVTPTNVIASSARIFLASNKMVNMDENHDIENDNKRKEKLKNSAAKAKQTADSANAAAEKVNKLKSLF
jgi:type VI secretion system protein VasD